MEGFLESNRLLRAVLDAMPLPVFVIDQGIRLVDCNQVGTSFLAEARTGLVHRLPGDILHCVVALASAGGCGTGPSCADCVLRGTITASLAQSAPVRRRGTLERMGADGPHKIDLIATATGIPGTDPALMLLILEDLTEAAELRALIPICAGCKRIRNDQDYWEQVEHYFARHLEVHFTHGLCEECVEKYYPELASGRKTPDPAPSRG